MSEQTAPLSIHSALAAAQGEFPTIKKNRTAKVKSRRTGQEYEYSYCTLDEIFAAVRPALAKYGLALRHVVVQEKGTTVEAILSHGAGDELRSGPLPVPNFEGDMQALGSGLTYARRYTATAVLGICAEEDDDAHGTPQKAPANPYREDQRRREPAPKQEQQAAAPAKTTEDFIAECKSAADLATLLTSLVGKYPVKDHADRWKHIGLAAKNRMESSDWADPHKAIVAAVLDGVRNQLKAPAASAKGDPAKAPALERICGWIDQQETPDDLLRVMIDIRDGARFLDLRADPQRVSDICIHALRFVKSKVDLKDWTDESVDAVCNEIDAIDAHYQLELQANATFGGGNETAS